MTGQNNLRLRDRKQKTRRKTRQKIETEYVKRNDKFLNLTNLKDKLRIRKPENRPEDKKDLRIQDLKIVDQMKIDRKLNFDKTHNTQDTLLTSLSQC